MKVSADYIELEREPFDSFQLSARSCAQRLLVFVGGIKSLRLEELADMHSVRKRFVLMLRRKWDKLAGVRTDVCSGLTEQSV